MLVRRVSSMRCAKGLLHVRLVWTWLHRRSQCPMCCASGFELRSNRWVWVWIKYLRHSTIWMRPSTLLGDHLSPASKVDKICNIWVSRLDLSGEPDNAKDASEIVDCTIGSSHCFQIPLLKIKMHHIFTFGFIARLSLHLCIVPLPSMDFPGQNCRHQCWQNQCNLTEFCEERPWWTCMSSQACNEPVATEAAFVLS